VVEKSNSHAKDAPITAIDCCSVPIAARIHGSKTEKDHPDVSQTSEVVIDGDRKIQIKFRADLVNLVEGNKDESSRSGESDNRHSTLFDNS